MFKILLQSCSKDSINLCTLKQYWRVSFSQTLDNSSDFHCQSLSIYFWEKMSFSIKISNFNFELVERLNIFSYIYWPNIFLVLYRPFHSNSFFFFSLFVFYWDVFPVFVYLLETLYISNFVSLIYSNVFPQFNVQTEKV